MTRTSLLNNDEFSDSWDSSLDEKKLKKQRKLERLEQKKRLIENIKTYVDTQSQQNNKVNGEMNSEKKEVTVPVRGTLAWAFHALGATESNTFENIRSKYLILAKTYHPDHKGENSVQKMKDINEAWHIIKLAKKTF